MRLSPPASCVKAGLIAEICNDLHGFAEEIAEGAGVAVLTDDAIRNADIKILAGWVNSQPPWSDFPFVLLTERGGGLERNPVAARHMGALGNVVFLSGHFIRRHCSVLSAPPCAEPEAIRGTCRP